MAIKISRKIDGSNGPYKISTITDSDNYRAEMNLYEPHLEKLIVGKIYKLDKIKKIIIGNKMRLCAVKFTTICEITDAKIEESFNDVKLGQHRATGTVEGIVDINFYQSCKTHLCKVDADRSCRYCEMEEIETIHNLTATMYLANDDDVLQIRFWKNQMKALSREVENTISEILDKMEGKKVTVEYDENSDGQNILIRIL